jgi:hypothetical protein
MCERYGLRFWWCVQLEPNRVFGNVSQKVLLPTKSRNLTLVNQPSPIQLIQFGDYDDNDDDDDGFTTVPLCLWIDSSGQCTSERPIAILPFEIRMFIMQEFFSSLRKYGHTKKNC